MRWLARILGLLLVLTAVIVGGSFIASESGEVVVLRTTDADGGRAETRLWVVDDGGRAWLRAGSPKSTWLAALQRNPAVEVDRGGLRASYTAVPVPAQRERINALLAEKYGWADAYIALLFGRDDATPIRLDPAGHTPG